MCQTRGRGALGVPGEDPGEVSAIDGAGATVGGERGFVADGHDVEAPGSEHQVGGGQPGGGKGAFGLVAMDAAQHDDTRARSARIGGVEVEASGRTRVDALVRGRHDLARIDSNAAATSSAVTATGALPAAIRVTAAGSLWPAPDRTTTTSSSGPTRPAS